MTDTAQEIRGTLQTYCRRATDDEIERAVQVLEHAFMQYGNTAYHHGVEDGQHDCFAIEYKPRNT